VAIQTPVPYVTVEMVKRTQVIIPTTDVKDDELLRGFCRRASRQFDRWCGRAFYPRTETRYYDHPDDDTWLKLDDDLLEVTTFTTENGDTTISSSDYFLMCGSRYGMTPYDRIVLKSSGSQPNLLYSGTGQQANAVTGIWGYHEAWADAWQDTGDTVQDSGGISASATTVTVSDVDGTDIWGISPRFEVQQLLQIGSESLFVTGKNETANTLTVRRGVNGTTAATHDADSAIYVYQAMEDIQEAIAEFAHYLWKLKDNAVFDVTATPALGTVTIPKGIPVQVKDAVDAYRRRRVGSSG